MTSFSHLPCSGMGCSMRRRSPSLISRSCAHRRSRRLLRRIWNRPRRVRPQMWVKPRKSNVSGLPSLSLARCAAAKRPNAISRGLLRMQCQRKLRQPLAHHVEKALAVGGAGDLASVQRPLRTMQGPQHVRRGHNRAHRLTPAKIAGDAKRPVHAARHGFDALCLDAAGHRPCWLRPVHLARSPALMLQEP